MRMKRLTISLRLFLTFFSLVLAENLLGQEPAAAALSGSGTENDPYQITSVADWNAFADAVNGGYDYSGKYIKLKENITINVGAGDKMAGVFVGKDNSANRPFNGTFDGNGNTITFNCGTVGSPIDVLACTLFRYTTGVTINNLTVTGTIVSKKKFAAGFIGWYHGSKQSQSYITNCTSHITINCSEIEEGASNKKWDCSTGGFIGQVEEGNVVFTNCVFDGSILKGTQANANRCAGFISYIQSNSVTYTYCTMAGTIDMAQPSNYSTFNRNGKNSFSKTYYITYYGDYKPSPALTTAPTDDIAKIYTKNNTDYYVPGAVITGVATTYSYIEGQPVEITPVVKYYGKTLTRGTDYVIKIDGTLVPTENTPTLSDADDYTFTIEGAGNYGGSYSTTIHVISYNDWVNVMTQLADDSEGARVVDLSADISAAVNDETNTALVVRGTVTLNLNGHTINRSLVHVNEDHEVVEDLEPDYNGIGLVIIVESGASLTINGPGTITGGFHKGNATYIDGGGIYNSGTLVLNNVNVVGNKVIKMTDEVPGIDNKFTGRGGGVYSGNGSTLIITGGEIKDNDSKGGGGGIFSDEANQFDMTNARVAFNVSEDKGGGVRVVISRNKTANLTNCKIMNNSATTNTESKGGGIYMEGKGNNACLNMVNDTLIANTSSLLGGAIYSHQGTIYTEHCHFFNNVSYDAVGITSGENSYGGAVYLYANSTFIINGGSIIGDWSKTNGGGIYVCPGAILKVKGLVVITDNVQMGDDETSSSNNVYLGGTDGVIEVIGQLDPKSVINITPNPDHEGTYVTFDEGTHSADPDDDLSYFVLDINNDNDEYNIILDNSGNVIVYEPYSWGDASTWNGSTIAEDGSTIAEFSGGSSSTPDSNSEVTIRRTLIINTGVIAYAKSISVDEHCRVVIEDGGQLIANSAIAAKVEKKVVAADEDNQTGWYLISSSVANPNIGNSTNLITEIQWDPTYDLYRFNENAELQWENYRADHEGFTTLQNGRGYLYRNANDHKVDIGGTLNVSDINYTLSCSGSELTGFNIIGNPYSHNIAKGEGQAIPNDYLEDNYYVLNPTTGAFELATDGEIIPPLTGILVQAKSASTLTINKVVASGSKGVKADNAEIQFTVSNNEFEDKAFVKFKEGHGLNKIEHLNEEAPMLYIHHNGEDFASVDMSDNTKQFNLNLEAKTTGKYTLSVEPQGAYKYLHLIDRLAEKDIDLLAEKEYSFIGSSADNAERFIVRLEHSDNVDSSVFAYQSGNEIVVSGEGELQIFDVMGRLVMQKHVSGVEAVEKPMATGVYVLKLNENIQKIIVK